MAIHIRNWTDVYIKKTSIYLSEAKLCTGMYIWIFIISLKQMFSNELYALLCMCKYIRFICKKLKLLK